MTMASVDFGDAPVSEVSKHLQELLLNADSQISVVRAVCQYIATQDLQRNEVHNIL